VTAVLYQQDERVLATAGAVDGYVAPSPNMFLVEYFGETGSLIREGLLSNISCFYFGCRVVKFWDTRSLKCPVAQTPVPQSELHEGIKVSFCSFCFALWLQELSTIFS